MKRFLLLSVCLLVASRAVAQVDIEHRRVLMLQTGYSAINSDETLSGFGAFWFNENHYPTTNTAFRFIYAGIYLDAELSYFVAGNTNTTIGLGAGGGVFSDGLTPYRDGYLLSEQTVYGDSANARVFVNQSIPNPTPLPLNLRATYVVAGQFYRRTDDTAIFTVPSDHLVQTALAELRFGGIEPGLTARRGAELYVAAEANYRNGFDAFGPLGAEYPVESKYTRLFGSLALKLPVGQTTVFGRLGGGLGDNLDAISAWKLGGNILNLDAYTLTLHGYYTREILARDFGIANVVVSQKLTDWHDLTGHLYADWAIAHTVAPQDGDWHNYTGVGVGLGFRTIWDNNVLLSYGYGFNALRNGSHGGHEIAIALEKKF
jgi:hypothetical protein